MYLPLAPWEAVYFLRHYLRRCRSYSIPENRFLKTWPDSYSGHLLPDLLLCPPTELRHITDRGLLILNIAKSLLAVTVINHFTAAWLPVNLQAALDSRNRVFGYIALVM